jgi:hypothetical protein
MSLYNTNESISEDIVSWNQFLVDETDELSASTLFLLPSCYAGTNLSVVPLPGRDNELEWFSGQAKSFEFYARISLSQIDETLLDRQQSLESVQVWFRLLLCNARHVGFCNPFVDVDTWTDEIYNPSKGENPLNDYKEGNMLLANSDQRTFSSQWVSWDLTNNNRNGNNDSYETTLNITTILPNEIEGLFAVIGELVFSLFQTQWNQLVVQIDNPLLTDDNHFDSQVTQ